MSVMLRIVGSRAECDRAVAVLRASAEELLVSRRYRVRTSPGIVRVYVTVRGWKTSTEAGEGQ